MKALFIISRRQKPSSRLRILQYLPALLENGIQADVLALEGKWLNRLRLLVHAGSYDTVVLQKKVLPLWMLRWLHKRVSRLIYDMDDAIWVDDQGKERQRQSAFVLEVARLCHLVVCGNPYLAASFKELGARVQVLPTPVDTDRTTFRGDPLRKPLRVGWLGTEATFPYLEMHGSEWSQLIREIPVEFHVISNRFPSTSFEYKAHLWSKSEECSLLHQLDIGLMPLPDNSFTRGKCAYKILQYQAAGVIPIASAVGYNREVIAHNETGYLVSQGTPWIDMVKQVLDQEDQGSGMRSNARQFVEQTHSLQCLTPRWVDILKGSS